MLVLVGIVLGFVGPKISPSRYQVQAATHTLGSTLLGAQRLALIRQHDVVLRFDVAAREIEFHEDVNGNGLVDAGEGTRREPLGDGVVLGLGGAPPRPMGAGPVTFERRRGGLPALIFHRNGSASEAGGLYVTSRRAALSGEPADETWAVEIERATGRPSWYRYTSSGWRRSF